MKIDSYKIAYDESIESLMRKVNGLLTDGWQPFGQVDYKNGWYIQTMVKYHTGLADPST